MAETMRLDKFIANQKSLTRSQVKDLIKHKAVTVNGQPAKSGDLKIYPDKDCINIQGETIIYKKNLYIMLNKPQGVVCSTRDGLSPTVLSLVPEELKRDGLFPAGRLDKDTVGFVLLTDDGDLAHRMLSPEATFRSGITAVWKVPMRKSMRSASGKELSSRTAPNACLRKSPQEMFPTRLL